MNKRKGMARQHSRRYLLRTISALGGFGLGTLIHRLLPHIISTPNETRPLPPAPVIIPRSDWGASLPDHTAINEYGIASSPLETNWYVYTRDLKQVYNTVAIHHSAHLLASDETMKSIQNLHMRRNGWADIGYHYGIDRNGVIYEGRDIHARGASVAGYNTGTIGVVVMGNFEVDQPFEAQLAALQQVVNWLAATYELSHVAGHSEFNPETVCPGRNLHIYLDELAKSAGLQRGTSGHVRPS